MAEAVGLAASVIAIAEITAKIGVSSMKLKKLWEDLQDVPERLKDLVEEIEFWRSMMRQIEKQIRASSSSVHQQLLEDLNLRAACGRCRSALDSLAHFVETLQEDVDRSKGRWKKMKLMKKTLSSTGPLDALDKRLHRAFSTLQGLLNVYNFSMGTGPKRHLISVPEEPSLQISTSDVARIAPLVDENLHKCSERVTSGPFHNEGNLRKGQMPHSKEELEKRKVVLDYDIIITKTLNEYMRAYRFIKRYDLVCALEIRLFPMYGSHPDWNCEFQLVEDGIPVLEDYLITDVYSASKDYRPPPQLRLSGTSLAFSTSKVIWLIQKVVGKHAKYRFPKWLLDGRIEVKADSQGRRPELTLRLSFSVDWWDDDIYSAVSDDHFPALLTLFATKRISIMQRNGWSLLHLAARLGSLRICEKLIIPQTNNSLEIMAKDISRTPWAFACLCLMGEQYADNYLRILRSFASSNTIFEPGKVEKCLTRHETLIFVITRAWSSLFVEGFRRQFAPRYHSLEISRRLMCARLAAKSVFYSCSVELFLDLLPEAEMAEGNILEVSREQKCSVIHSVAFRIGRSCLDHEIHSENSSPECFWHEILKSAVRIDADSLHFVENVAPFQSVPMRQTPFISLLQSAFDACMGDVSDDSIPRLLRRWLETLKSSGVNLLLYGREEYRLYQANNSLLHQRFIAWTSRRQLHRIRLAGIVYGDLPQHWSLIWVDEPNGFAGDFWNLVEPQDRACQPPSITVPGEWKDELDEDNDVSDNEYNDDIWRWAEGYEERRLVWTEYRRHRDTTGAVDICHGSRRRSEKIPKTKAHITGNVGSAQIASQPGVLSVVAHSEPTQPSDAELRRKAKNFMKFWKRQR